MPDNPSIQDVLNRAPWSTLEEHLGILRDRVDTSVEKAHRLRREYRDQLLLDNPDISARIMRPSDQSLRWAEDLISSGTVAAADGTVAPVPLLAGSKIQVAVVIVFNSGEVVNLVTRVFETELVSHADNPREFFTQLRKARSVSNLLSRAIMLFGERRLLMDQPADWRMVHGELIPHELRTGAGRPNVNLGPTFALINEYIASEQFIAVSESTDDIDVLNAAILLEPGEYIEIRTMTDDLTLFLEGDPSSGQARANFAAADERRFREFIQAAGPEVSIVLVKAGQRPFLVECHRSRVEQAISLFLADSLWTRGVPPDGQTLAVRGFPFHLDLADQVARTLFKGSDFRNFVESRLMDLGIAEGVFDLDPRRTRG